MENRVYGKVISADTTADEKVLMTRPDGMPAMVPGDLVDHYRVRKGFAIGYDPEVERERQIETRIMNEERAKFLMRKQSEDDKKAEATARRKAKAALEAEFGKE